MNQALEALYALQQVDSALAQAHKQYQALDPGRTEKAAAETAHVLYDRLARTTQETERDLHDSELELRSVEEKKKNFEARLYGGRITVPREMTDMEHEIEALGRQRGRLDEHILTLMDQLEVRRAEEREAHSRLEAADAALAAKEAEYKAAARRLATEIRALTARREEMAQGIPPAVLKRYDVIRAARGGVGIARISDGLCGACHTSLPSNLISEVAETDVLGTCENCGRLLCVAVGP